MLGQNKSKILNLKSDAPTDARSDARSSLTLRYRYRFANANAALSEPTRLRFATFAKPLAKKTLVSFNPFSQGETLRERLGAVAHGEPLRWTG
ncbi:MAG: hypothetical protein V7K40_25545 [Nostoc sp.]